MLGSCKHPVDVLVAKDSSSPSTSGWIGVHNIYLVMAALDSLHDRHLGHACKIETVVDDDFRASQRQCAFRYRIRSGLCTSAGEFAAEAGYPFRILWYAPLTGAMIVFLVSVVAAGIGAVLVPKLEPYVVFAGRRLGEVFSCQRADQSSAKN
jgi:hypothetical protein